MLPTPDVVGAVLATLVAGLVTGAPDPSVELAEVVRLAMHESDAARAQEELTAAARARTRIARSFLFPELGLTASYTRRMYETLRTVEGQTIVVQSHDALAGALVLNQTLLDARAFPAWDAAEAEERATELDGAEIRRRLGYRAAFAYFAVLAAERRGEAVERRLALAQATLEGASSRSQAGLASKNDVTRAALEVASAERDLVLAEGEKKRARLELAFVAQRSIEGALAEPAGLLTVATSTPTLDLAGWLGRARESRLELRAADQRARAVELRGDAAQLGLVPSVDLVGNLRATNEGGLVGRNFDGNVGVVLSWTPYDGGRRGAEASEQEALLNAAALSRAELGRRVAVEVEDAFLTVEASRAELRRARELVAVARTNHAETAELYRQGLTGMLVLADSTQRLFEAEVEELRARYGLVTAWLSLRAAAGLMPLEEESS